MGTKKVGLSPARFFEQSLWQPRRERNIFMDAWLFDGAQKSIVFWAVFGRPDRCFSQRTFFTVSSLFLIFIRGRKYHFFARRGFVLKLNGI